MPDEWRKPRQATPVYDITSEQTYTVVYKYPDSFVKCITVYEFYRN